MAAVLDTRSDIPAQFSYKSHSDRPRPAPLDITACTAEAASPPTRPALASLNQAAHRATSIWMKTFPLDKEAKRGDTGIQEIKGQEMEKTEGEDQEEEEEVDKENTPPVRLIALPPRYPAPRRRGSVPCLRSRTQRPLASRRRVTVHVDSRCDGTPSVQLDLHAAMQHLMQSKEPPHTVGAKPSSMRGKRKPLSQPRCFTFGTSHVAKSDRPSGFDESWRNATAPFPESFRREMQMEFADVPVLHLPNLVVEALSSVKKTFGQTANHIFGQSASHMFSKRRKSHHDQRHCEAMEALLQLGSKARARRCLWMR